MRASQSQPSPIEYPAEFPIKVMGRNVAGFAQTVAEMVQRHARDFDPATLEMRASRQNNYLSVTCTIVATSRQQLDALYTELSSHPMVSLVL